MKIWKKFSWPFKIFFLLVLFYFLYSWGALRWPETWLAKISHPIIFRFSWFLQKENQEEDWRGKFLKLEKEKESWAVDFSELYQLREENERLRQILGFSKQVLGKLVLADLIFEDNFLSPEKNSRQAVINRGAQDGLEVGQVVLSPQGSVVGKVLAVKDSSASICFLSSASCRLAVKISNSQKSIGISQGELGLSVKVDFVSQAEKISLGDMIMSSGLEEKIPAGLPLGQVSRAESKDNDVWQDIFLEPLADFDRLRLVAVLIN